MKTKEEILVNIDHRPTRDSYRDDDIVSARSLEAICEVLIDIRDILNKKPF